MSYELQTPLSTILARVQSLQQEQAQSQYDALNTIDHDSEHLLQLIHSMSLLANVETTSNHD